MSKICVSRCRPVIYAAHCDSVQCFTITKNGGEAKLVHAETITGFIAWVDFIGETSSGILVACVRDGAEGTSGSADPCAPERIGKLYFLNPKQPNVIMGTALVSGIVQSMVVDGQLVATGSATRMLRVWALSALHGCANLVAEVLASGEGDPLMNLSVALDADAGLVVSGGADGFLRLWRLDIDAGSLQESCAQNNPGDFEGAVHCFISVDRVACLIAVGCEAGALHMWRYSAEPPALAHLAMVELAEPPDPWGRMWNRVALHAGHLVSMNPLLNKLSVWSAGPSGIRPISSMELEERRAARAFDLGGNQPCVGLGLGRLAMLDTGDTEFALRSWGLDLATGDLGHAVEIASLPVWRAALRAVHLDMDRDLVVAADNSNLSIWHLDRHKGKMSQLAVSGHDLKGIRCTSLDNRAGLLAVSGSDNLQLWRLSPLKMIASTNIDESVWSLCLDVAGGILLTTTDPINREGGKLHLWQIQLVPGVQLEHRVEHCLSGGVTSLRLAGRLAVTGGLDDVLRFWNVSVTDRTLQQTFAVKGAISGTNWISDMSLIAASGLLLTKTRDGFLKLWNIGLEGTCCSELARSEFREAWEEDVDKIAFDPTGRLLVVKVRGPLELRAWHVTDDMKLEPHWLPFLTGERITSVDASNGVLLVGTEGGEMLWTPYRASVVRIARKSAPFLDHFKDWHMPVVGYISVFAAKVVTMGQLLGFAWQGAKPPVVERARTALHLDALQYFGLDWISYVYAFVTSVLCILTLIAIIVVQESVQERKLLYNGLGGVHKAWGYIHLAMGFYCQGVATVGFVPLFITVSRAFLCSGKNGTLAMSPDVTCWSPVHILNWALPALLSILGLIYITYRLNTVGGELSRLEVKHNIFDQSEDIRASKEDRRRTRQHPLSAQSLVYAQSTFVVKAMLALVHLFLQYTGEKARVLFAVANFLQSLVLVAIGLLCEEFFEAELYGAPALPWGLYANAVQTAVDVGVAWQFACQLLAAGAVTLSGENALRWPCFVCLPVAMPALMVLGYWCHRWYGSRLRYEKLFGDSECQGVPNMYRPLL